MTNLHFAGSPSFPIAADLSDDQLFNALSDAALNHDVAATLATAAFKSDREAAIFKAIDALSARDTSADLTRASLLVAARERALETLDGQRLCACLLLVNWDADEDFTRLSSALLQKLSAQGFPADPRFMSVPEAQSLSSRDIQALHENARGRASALWPAKPGPSGGGLQLRVLFASLPGIARGTWDELDQDRQALALASLMDAAQAGWPDGVVALAAAPLGAALRQADAAGCPVALRVLVQSACDRGFCKPVDLAAACSLHDQGSAAEAPFWRLSVRVKDTGFTLCSMDWPLSGMSAESVFYDGVILELASLGVDECYQIEGAYDQLLCPDCGEPIYPAPDLLAWREAALEAGLSPNGQHNHH